MKRLVVVCATCGVGKSTVVENLKGKNLGSEYEHFDEILNWHEYSSLPNGGVRYFTDSVNKAIELSEDKHILWATCMNPNSYYELDANEMISQAIFVNLMCDDGELTRRLKGRPVERMTHTDEFIATQIEYMNWFRKNTHLMDLVIDSTNQTIDETTELVREFIRNLDNDL